MTTPLLLVALGAVLTLDGVAVGQFMISRPLVASTLAALLLGDPASGLLVGAILEGFLLVSVPSGGGRFPEPGHAAVVAAAAAVWTGGPAGLALGVTLGLLFGWIGALTQGVQRQINTRWIPDPARGRVTMKAVVRGHLISIALDGVRGAALTGIGLGVVALLAPWMARGWPLGATETRGLLLIGVFVALGIVARTLVQRHRWVALAIGLVVGLVLGGAA